MLLVTTSPGKRFIKSESQILENLIQEQKYEFLSSHAHYEIMHAPHLLLFDPGFRKNLRTTDQYG